MRLITSFFVSRDITRYFGFLARRGYKIREVKYYPDSFGNWEAYLVSPKCQILIHEDRGEIQLACGAVTQIESRSVQFFDLGLIIYYLSDGKEFIGYFDGNLSRERKRQYERLAKLLCDHIDEIESFFLENDAYRRLGLMELSVEYNERLLRSF